MAWFHLKLEDFPDAEIPQLMDGFGVVGLGFLGGFLSQGREFFNQPCFKPLK